MHLALRGRLVCYRSVGGTERLSWVQGDCGLGFEELQSAGDIVELLMEQANLRIALLRREEGNLRTRLILRVESDREATDQQRVGDVQHVLHTWPQVSFQTQSQFEVSRRIVRSP